MESSIYCIRKVNHVHDPVAPFVHISSGAPGRHKKRWKQVPSRCRLKDNGPIKRGEAR